MDDPERGFSYRRDAASDMRMDRSRGRTAAQILQSIAEDDLAAALRDQGDEPDAQLIAAAIVKERDRLRADRRSGRGHSASRPVRPSGNCIRRRANGTFIPRPERFRRCASW